MPIEESERQDAAARLRRLLRPTSIVVAGGNDAAEVIRQCRAIGYEGSLAAIHPHREAIAGVHCVRSVAELAQVPDAAFLAVPPAATVQLVGQLAQRGCGGAVCYASGFAEIGGAGAALQARLVQAAGAMPLLGPNGYGFVNYLDGVALWPDRHGGRRLTHGERGVALLTQSGNIALNLTMQRRHLPLAAVFALGNAAALHFHTLLDALSADERISAIGLHIEGLADVPAFAEAALRALDRGVAIVAIKTGASQLGAKLAASHTDALAGRDVLFDALFDRVGIARVHDLAEWIEALKLLHAGGPLHGSRVAAMSCSGGEASLVADLGAKAGIEFPPPDAASASRLNEVLGHKVPPGNPLDYHTYIWGDEAALTACFAAMADLPVDLALLVLDFPVRDEVAEDEQVMGWDESLRAFIAALKDRPAVRGAVVSSLAEGMPAAQAQRLLAAGIAPLQGLREAVIAIRAAARIGQRRSAPRPLTLWRTSAGPTSAPASETLDEAAGKALLAAHGVAVPEGCVIDAATSADRMADLLAAAGRIGYPVVLKAVSAQVLHKTEHGAVELNLGSATDLRAAADRLASHPRWLVERMVTGAVAELIAGITRDPKMGLALTIGMGGVCVEVLDDTATLLLPVQAQDVEAALRGLRGFALLNGYRGRPRASMAEIVQALMAIARCAQALGDRCSRIEVNPLIVLADGAVAADTVAILGVYDGGRGCESALGDDGDDGDEG
jgi:acyl-CoA synthetase (NDP forming)